MTRGEASTQTRPRRERLAGARGLAARICESHLGSARRAQNLFVRPISRTARLARGFVSPCRVARTYRPRPSLPSALHQPTAFPLAPRHSRWPPSPCMCEARLEPIVNRALWPFPGHGRSKSMALRGPEKQASGRVPSRRSAAQPTNPSYALPRGPKRGPASRRLGPRRRASKLASFSRAVWLWQCLPARHPPALIPALRART